MRFFPVIAFVSASAPCAARIPLLRYRGVKSVYEFLKEKGGLAVLNDANVEIATREVLANGRSRPQITKDIRRKVRRNCHDFRVDNSRDRLKHILVGHAF